MSTSAALNRLEQLAEESAAARLCGLDRDRAYMADLEDEIAACRAVYVGFAVTEIATIRGQTGGRLQG